MERVQIGSRDLFAPNVDAACWQLSERAVAAGRRADWCCCVRTDVVAGDAFLLPRAITILPGLDDRGGPGVTRFQAVANAGLQPRLDW
jgi:hypothetical protein